MTAIQEILTSFKKAPSGETNGNGIHAPAELPRSNEARSAWQRLIDDELIEWGRHPDQFEDEDGYKAPTPDNLVRATEFIVFCRDQGLAPPLRMAPDGEGGIVFEWTDNPPYYYNVVIRLDGKTEMLKFLDCKLIARQSIGGEHESGDGSNVSALT